MFGSTSKTETEHEGELRKRLDAEKKRLKRLPSKSRYKHHRLRVIHQALRLMRNDYSTDELATLLHQVGISEQAPPQHHHHPSNASSASHSQESCFEHRRSASAVPHDAVLRSSATEHNDNDP